jgi:hypothetical protein
MSRIDQEGGEARPLWLFLARRAMTSHSRQPINRSHERYRTKDPEPLPYEVSTLLQGGRG